MSNERYAGNVTKTATMGVAMVGAVMTILVFIAGRFGIELPSEVQAAISTLILGATAYFFGRNAVGEKVILRVLCLMLLIRMLVTLFLRR